MFHNNGCKWASSQLSFNYVFFFFFIMFSSKLEFSHAFLICWILKQKLKLKVEIDKKKKENPQNGVSHVSSITTDSLLQHSNKI